MKFSLRLVAAVEFHNDKLLRHPLSGGSARTVV